MSIIDMGAKNLKAIGFGAAMPEERDRLLGMVTGSDKKAQDEKMAAMQAEIAAGKKPKQAFQAGVPVMKKGGKVKRAKRFNDGGMSLEEKYPEAKITRAGPQPKPVEQPPKTILQEALRGMKEAEYKELSKKAELAPYERKAEKFGKGARGGSGGGGGGASGGGDFSGMKGLDKPYKAGGKVKSASARADGCCIKGKTKA